MTRLQDKIVLVTGAAGAVGQAVAAAVKRQGGAGVATDLAQRAGIDHALDVASEDDWRSVLSVIEHAHGGLDGLVNAAGLVLIGSVEGTDHASRRRLLAGNF